MSKRLITVLILILYASQVFAIVKLEVRNNNGVSEVFAVNNGVGHFRIKVEANSKHGNNEIVMAIDPNQSIKLFSKQGSIDLKDIDWQIFVGSANAKHDTFLYQPPIDNAPVIFEGGSYRFSTKIETPVKSARSGVLIALNARAVGGWTAYVEHEDLTLGEYKGIEFSDETKLGDEITQGTVLGLTSGRNFHFSVKSGTPNVGYDNESSLSTHLVEWAKPVDVSDSDSPRIRELANQAEVATGKVSDIQEKATIPSKLALSTPPRSPEEASLIGFVAFLASLIAVGILISWYSNRKLITPPIRKPSTEYTKISEKTTSRSIFPKTSRSDDRIGGDNVRTKKHSSDL